VSTLLLAGVAGVALLAGSGVEARLHAKVHAHRHPVAAPVAAPAVEKAGKEMQAMDSCGASYGSSGDFDYYVYAQSWPAAFCQAHTDWPGCSQPTAWQQQNLSLHGLWPNYNAPRGSHDWPQCCQSSFGTDLDVSLAKSLLPALQTYWPNEQDPSGSDLSNSLWAHEWTKHGTCSGLDQRTYFTQAMNIEISSPTAAAISNNVGGTAYLSDLKDAYRMNRCSSGSDCWTGLSCSGSGSDQQLTGITTCWDTSFQQIICPAMSISGQQCTSEQINIPSF